MSTLTITAKGQVTLRKDLLQHLGVHPGEKIMVEKLPDGRVEMKAVANRQDLPRHPATFAVCA
jgi:AbrB family looped-hinge helix DNA binding protein